MLQFPFLWGKCPRLKLRVIYSLDVWVVYFLLVGWFDAGTYSIFQADLEFTIFLPQPPVHWDCRHAQTGQAVFSFCRWQNSFQNACAVCHPTVNSFSSICYSRCLRFWLQTSWSMCNNISAVFIMLSLICIPLMLTISSCAYHHLEILFREVSRVATRGIWKAEGPVLHRSKLCPVWSRTWGASFLPLRLVSSSILSFFPALLPVACLTFVITTHRKKAAEKEEIPSLL